MNESTNNKTELKDGRGC